MIAAIILAKADSTRLPGKNMMTINGAPLFVHAIRYAQASNLTDRVVVSTDSDEIERIAVSEGAEVVRRGPELCGDASNAQVIDHALGSICEEGMPEVSWVVCLQPDHPGRKQPLDEALRYAMQNDTDILLSVHRDGILSGSFRIYGKRALGGGLHMVAHTMMDDCLNIHTKEDLAMAAQEMSPYRDEIDVAGRKIGRGHPAFVVAEAGCNHLCDMKRAKEMIDSAKQSGADAIKFQTYKAERLVRKDAPLYWGDDGPIYGHGKESSQLSYYRKLDLFGPDEYAKLFAHAKEAGIIAFSTPFDTESADMLDSLGAPLFKIASCDLPDIRLLRHVAGFGKPMILSTGASTPSEIDRAVSEILMTGNHQLVLMACVLGYPTFTRNANMMRIRTLRERYPNIMTGLSDHTEPDHCMVIPSLAVPLGAVVIEKHFTLDRSLKGGGNHFATAPLDFRRLVLNIRLAEETMGDGSLGIMKVELGARESARRSIVAARPIRSGETIESAMLTMKRPGEGLSGFVMDDLIGRVAARDISEDFPIKMNDLL